MAPTDQQTDQPPVDQPTTRPPHYKNISITDISGYFWLNIFNQSSQFGGLFDHSPGKIGQLLNIS